MAKLTGGELLVDALRGSGVKHVFSIIGGQMCSVYDALSHRPEMNLVTLRNEAAAPMMAAGCTAVTGVPSVSMATVGAGVVYELAGLMAAWYAYLPVISIAPQVQSWKMNPHQENLQGLNQHGIFEPVTKWNAIIYHWERIPSLTQRAIREALANAPGPVHLDVPVDVLFKTGKVDGGKSLIPPAGNTRFSGALPGPERDVREGCEAVSRSQRPLVLVGQGMGRPGRYPGLRDMLNELGAPVLLGDTCSGVMDGRDESYVSALGLFQCPQNRGQAMAEADLLLVIGLDDQVKHALDSMGADQQTVVQVEVDPSALFAGRKDHLGVNADPVSFLSALTEAVQGNGGRWKAWLKDVQQAGASFSKDQAELMPRHASIFKGIASSLSEDDVIVVDGEDTVRRIGAPDKNVILVTDKDSMLRQVQELQTAVGFGIAFSIVCVDPGEGESLSRTEAILQGLGCETAMLEPGKSPDIKQSSRPQAFICT